MLMGGQCCSDLECGGKRSATPLFLHFEYNSKRRRRFALPAHSKLK
jgi:hypothetical protein